MKITAEQMSIFDLDIWCGKTSSEHSVQTTEKISESSLKRQPKSSTRTPIFLDMRNGQQQDAYWQSGIPSLGESWTPSTGESPSVVVESHLWQILEDNPHPRYCLSAKACQGILNRAERRGKVLPEMLLIALKQTIDRASVSKNVQENPGGKGILIQDDHTGALSTDPNQFVVDRHAFGISSYGSNAMKSPNPNSGVYEADTSRTLDLNGGNPACNKGGVAIVALEGNGQRPSHMGNGYAETDKPFTLNTTEVHGVTYSVDMGGGKSACNILEDQSPTLTCTHYGEPVVAHNDRSNCYTCKPGMMLRFNNKMDKDLSVTIDTSGGDNQTTVVYEINRINDI